MQISTKDIKVIAVLGPTNTGKTYFAMERLLAHGSGIIGFPLRLLARENYERARAIKGPSQVALITGEEKIVPKHAKYFFCTVESMPLAMQVDFLAVDEIQLCADVNRGHFFTDRLLYSRGRHETMFMGSENMRPIIKRLLPCTQFVTRPRFSTLSYSGRRKINRLPPRSVVVGFSSAEVYAAAELIRQQRGGAAIVMGALSPRTRKAQVELFQNGDVDYLVATDAIGMGLNMDVDHVAFASLDKFDGMYRRELRPEELAQIAGRAGRHMRNGTFGVTCDALEINLNVIEKIESHRFDAIKNIQWRNSNIDFYSVESLINSLSTQPSELGLTKTRQPNDEKLLAQLISEKDIEDRLTDHYSVQLLWEVCQIPDFRKKVIGGHMRLLSYIFQSLQDKGKLDHSWITNEITRIDRIDGGIETLVDRIANIRIWTYISNRQNWVTDPEDFQVRTRKIEDRLSDALHERLTQRFVDQRAAGLARKLKDKEVLQSNVSSQGDVLVEGHFFGRVDGFKFIPDTTDGAFIDCSVAGSVNKAIVREVERRALALINEKNSNFELWPDGKIVWLRRGNIHIVAYLLPGRDMLKPDVRFVLGNLSDGPVREKVEQRIKIWVNKFISKNLEPLYQAREYGLIGTVGGLIFQLLESGGVLSKREVAIQLKGLKKRDYGILNHLGIKIGKREVFFPKLLKPRVAVFCSLLWAIKHGLNPIPKIPAAGRVSVNYDESISSGFMQAAGYRRAGNLMVRVDILERITGILKSRAANNYFGIGPELLNLLGCSSDDIVSVLESLGYEREKQRSIKEKGGPILYVRKKKKYTYKSANRRVKNVELNDGLYRRSKFSLDDSPFAKLKGIASR
jgi:ATP-dependent RNA helicase SUPV3L1/SUV3